MKYKINLETLRVQFLVLFINSVMIVDLFRYLCKLLLIPDVVITPIRNFIYIIIFLYVILDAFIKKRILYLIIPLAIYFFLFLFSYIFFIEIRAELVSYLFLFVSRGLAGLYLGRYADTKEVFAEQKKYYIIMALYIILYFMNTDINFMDGSYMTFGYNIIIQSTIFILYTLKSFKLFNILISATLFVIILVSSARGVVVCFLIVVAFYILLSQKFLKKKYIILFFLILLIIFMSVFWVEITFWMQTQFPNSRTVHMMVNGSLFDLSNRNYIFNDLITEITSNPFVVRGIFAERYFLFSNSGIMNVEALSYAHNIIVEVIFDFGIIVGIILLIILCSLITTAVKKIKSNDSELIIFLCFSTGLITLFFSSSFLVNERFWLFLGLCIGCASLKHSRKN